MRLAQQEAERLATLGRLEPAKFNTSQKYVGFSIKTTGKSGENWSRIFLIEVNLKIL